MSKNIMQIIHIYIYIGVAKTCIYYLFHLNAYQFLHESNNITYYMYFYPGSLLIFVSFTYH